MNKDEEKAYKKMVQEVAHQMVTGCYKEAIKITDGVYRAILRSMRDEINEILKEK